LHFSLDQLDLAKFNTSAKVLPEASMLCKLAACRFDSDMQATIFGRCVHETFSMAFGAHEAKYF
jgi:hypothetical protein